MKKLTTIDSPLKLLVFENDWCAQCYTERKVIHQIADQYHGQVKVSLINGQDHPEIIEQFHVQSAPSLVLIKNHQVVEQIPRFMDQNQLQSLLNYYR